MLLFFIDASNPKRKPEVVPWYVPSIPRLSALRQISKFLQGQQWHVPTLQQLFFVFVGPHPVNSPDKFSHFSLAVAEETPPPAELLCLDVLHKSTDDGAVVTLTPCALGDDAAAEDGTFDEQKWEFSKVTIHSSMRRSWNLLSCGIPVGFTGSEDGT